MRYDIASKRLVEIGKEAILRWFLGIEVESAELIEELPKETVSLRRSDFPLLVRDKEGGERIVLMEFQTRWEPDLPLRILEYFARFKLKYRLPVFPVVLLFKRYGGVEEVYEDETIRMRLQVVRMWEIDGRELIESGEVALYPFVPLTSCEDEDVMEADRRIYSSDLERSVKSDLLTALAIFAGLRSEDLMRKLFERRRDIMIESPAYELIRREGFEEGVKFGMLEDARDMLLNVLEERFGVVPVRIVEAVKGINEREVLRGLLRRAIKCVSLEEFEGILREAMK